MCVNYWRRFPHNTDTGPMYREIKYWSSFSKHLLQRTKLCVSSGFIGCKKLLPRWTKKVWRARGFFHSINMELMGTKQNTTTMTKFDFDTVKIQNTELQRYGTNNKESIFKQERCSYSFGSHFIHYTYIHSCFMISIPHARNFVLLHWDSNNEEVKSRLILSDLKGSISPLAFRGHSFSVMPC